MVVSNCGQYGSLHCHYHSTPGSAWRHLFDCDSKNLLLTVLCMPTSVVLFLVFMLVSVRYALSHCCVIPQGNSVNLLQNCDRFAISLPGVCLCCCVLVSYLFVFQIALVLSAK